MSNTPLAKRQSGTGYLIDILNGRREGWGYDVLRSALAVLAGVYCLGLEGYLWLERVHLRKRSLLPVPVVSVGNLSVGGTGKTPFVQYLCREFAEQGWRAAVLSRGHGSEHGQNVLVVSDGNGNLLADAKQSGDEACLLAESLPGSMVVIGKDRRIAGKLAIERFAPDLIVLDDGFQYWQLERDLDIVLLDGAEPFANGHTLPRGLLREPKSHLNRAQIVVVTRADAAGQTQRATLREMISELSPKALVFFATHESDGWEALNDLAVGKAPENAFCFCGVARPDSFVKSVKSETVSLAGEPLTFDDHERYGEAVLRKVLVAAKESRASSIVTTQKDAVKIDCERLPLPAFALRTRVVVDDGQLLISSIRRYVTGSKPWAQAT